MEKKIYRLEKKLIKYKIPTDNPSKSFYDFQMYINRSRLQKAFKARKKLIKKYKKPNDFVLILKLLAFYYALVGLIILLSKIGI